MSPLPGIPERTRGFIGCLHSPAVLEALAQISGIGDPHPDPGLRGGGIHAIGRGGFLMIHTDFSWHPGLSMHRRLNLLVYLNDD